MAYKPQSIDNECYLTPEKSNDKENTIKVSDCDSLNEQSSNFLSTTSNDATLRSFKTEMERWSTAENIYWAENNYYIHPEESPITNEPVLLKAKIKLFDTSPLHQFLVTPSNRSLLIIFLKHIRCSQYSSLPSTPEFARKLTSETLRPLFEILNSADLERFIESPYSTLENFMVNPTKPEYVSRITQLMVLVKPGNLKQLLSKFFLNFVYLFPRYPYLLFKSKLNPTLEKTDFYVPFQTLLPDRTFYTRSQIDKDFLDIIDITLGTDVSVKNVTTRLVHFLSNFRTHFMKFIKDLRTEKDIPNSNLIFSPDFSKFNAINISKLGKKHFKDLKSIKLRKLSRKTSDAIRSAMSVSTSSFNFTPGSTSDESSQDIHIYTPIYAKRDLANGGGITIGYSLKSNSVENLIYQGNLDVDEDLFIIPPTFKSRTTGVSDKKVNSTSDVTVSPCYIFGENDNCANEVFVSKNILKNEREEESPLYALTYDTKNNLVHHYENPTSLYDLHIYEELEPATNLSEENHPNSLNANIDIITMKNEDLSYSDPGVAAEKSHLSRSERLHAIRKRLRSYPIYVNVGRVRLDVIFEQNEEVEENSSSCDYGNDINSTLRKLERIEEALQKVLLDCLLARRVSEPRKVGPLFPLCLPEFTESLPVKKDDLIQYLDSGNSSFLGLEDLFQTVSLFEESGPPSPDLLYMDNLFCY